MYGGKISHSTRECGYALQISHGLREAAVELDDSCDAFFHLAWTGTVGAARNDMFQQNKNVEYALEAVELAASLGCKIFVGAGSQAEYGRVEGKLCADTPVFPENGYGIAKLCAGQMTRIAWCPKGHTTCLGTHLERVRSV